MLKKALLILVLAVACVAIWRYLPHDDHAGHDHANETTKNNTKNSKPSDSPDDHAGHDHAPGMTHPVPLSTPDAHDDCNGDHAHAAEAPKTDAHDDCDGDHAHAAEAPKTDAHDDCDGDHAHAAEAPKTDAHDDCDGDHTHAAEAPHMASSSDAEKPCADDHAHDDEAAAPSLVSLTSEQRKLIRLVLSTATERALPEELKLHGELRLNAEATARIMPRMPGFVAEVLVREGDHVEDGTLLAKFVSHKLGEYYSDYNTSVESESLANAEFEMASKLRKGNAISEKEFLRYKRELAESKISRKRAEALLKSLLLDPAHKDHDHGSGKTPADPNAICTEYEMRSPITGTILERALAPGENFAEDNTRTVFVVSDLQKPWLELFASHRQMRLVKKGMKVSVTPSDSTRRYEGTVLWVSPVMDPVTRTGIIRVLVQNPDRSLRPGEFAIGSISLPVEQKTVTVPRDAVQLIAGETVLFLPKGDAFQAVSVKTGRTVGASTVILSGLRAGEKFVSEGAFELKSILLTSGMDPHAGHGH